MSPRLPSPQDRWNESIREELAARRRVDEREKRIQAVFDAADADERAGLPWSEQALDDALTEAARFEQKES